MATTKAEYAVAIQMSSQQTMDCIVEATGYAEGIDHVSTDRERMVAYVAGRMDSLARALTDLAELESEKDTTDHAKLNGLRTAKTRLREAERELKS